jgi:hypothetical protein
MLALSVAWVALATEAAQAGEAPAKSEFWAMREAAYRGSPRGPFTAIGAYYVGAGEEVTVFVEGDSLRVERTPGSSAGMRVRFGADGFSLGPAGELPLVAPACRGGLLLAMTPLGRSVDDSLDVHLGRFLVSMGAQDEKTGRVVVYDPDLLARRFHGFAVFAGDARYRVEARVLSADGDTLALGTTRGRTKHFVRAAKLAFEIDGKPCELFGFRAPGDPGTALFVPFRDATSGKQSYGVARYLDVEVEKRETGEVAVVDFNHATNPWCAYSPWYNCVLPPEENTLPMAILAGEMAPADAAGH